METKAGTVFNQFYEAIRKEERRLNRKMLGETLESRDKNKIIKYCYHRATRKDITRMMDDLIIFGNAQNKLTDDKCHEIIRRMTWWALRLNRICGI